MQTVRSVGVLSFAKVFALIHACFGLLFAPLFLLAGIAASIGNDKSAAILGGTFGIVMALLMPVLYGVAHAQLQGRRACTITSRTAIFLH